MSSTSQAQLSKCLHYNSFLRPTHSTMLQGHICNSHLDTDTRVLKHFKLYIAKTHFSFNLLIFFCDGKTVLYSPESDSQVSTGPSAIALVSFPSSLPFCCCTDPCYFFPMTVITLLLISMPSLHGPILNTARAIF